MNNPTRLTKVRVYAITYTDLNDGHRMTHSVFTSLESANKRYDFLHNTQERAHEQDFRVVETPIWKDDNGNYYHATLREINVDVPTRQQALAKLTDADKRVLGLN